MRWQITFLLLVLILHAQAKTSAVLDSSYTRIEVRSIDRMQITEFKRWEIRDEDGYRYCLYNDYQNAFRKVKSLRYTIFDAAGNRVRKFGLNDAQDVMFNASYEVTDSRMLLLDPGYRNFPFFVEIETVVVHDQFLDFPDWMPRYADNMEVKFAGLSFQCGAGYQFRSRSFNFKGDSVVRSTGDVKAYTWTLRNLPAVAKYLSDRVFANDQPRISISPLGFRMGGIVGSYLSWSTFGDWYLALNKSPYVLTDGTKRDLEVIKKNSRDEKDLVRNVYRYMQQKTRYVSIQLGIGGFKALPVEHVDKNGYGDCKALSQYMHALLTEVGVTPNYVLVKAGQDVPDVLPDVPSNQFNHIFLGVPHASDTTWLECTSQVVPASYLGKFTDDRNVLWLAPGKSSVIRTPRFTASESIRKSASVVYLDGDGNAMITINRSQGGVYFDEMMDYSAMSVVQQEQLNHSKFYYRDFSIRSFKYGILPLDMTLTLEYEIKVNALATRARDRLFLPLNISGAPEKAGQEICIEQLWKHRDLGPGTAGSQTYRYS